MKERMRYLDKEREELYRRCIISYFIDNGKDLSCEVVMEATELLTEKREECNTVEEVLNKYYGGKYNVY